MLEEIEHYAPDTTLEERENLRWKFIYDYWVYGCTGDEEFYLHLKDKTDEEQKEQFFIFFFIASCFIVLKVINSFL